MKRSVALFAAVVVFHADVAIVWLCAVAVSSTAYGVMDLAPWTAGAMALVTALVVWVASAPLCGGWMWRRAGQIRRWGAPDTVYWPRSPADPLAPRPAPAPAVAPKSRSTKPRALMPYELANWLCPWCEEPAVKGTHEWEDRGPFQLLSNHTLVCPGGCRWTDSTDGG
ncbi:hypothetical protein ACFC7A_27050 [Streptomyces niveus]|uniref:hypothetical protein n=1 Tax=Streptomyces niveus TaxID=193462 RepID=UPI0035D9A890